VFYLKSKMSFLFALRGIPGKFIRPSSFKELGRILLFYELRKSTKIRILPKVFFDLIILYFSFIMPMLQTG
jgi:hypothetical protein